MSEVIASLWEKTVVLPEERCGKRVCFEEDTAMVSKLQSIQQRNVKSCSDGENEEETKMITAPIAVRESQ